MLRWVFALNAAMFFIEGFAGWIAGSSALMADSLDMLADALAYGTSLYVVQRGARAQAQAALFKGLLMGAMAAGVLLETLSSLGEPHPPLASVMGGIGLLALLVNTLCFGILWRARDGNLNLRSAWLCSRNDMLANLAVLLAAGGVVLTGQAWPDTVVGLAIVLLFSHTAIHVTHAAWRALAQ